MEIHQSQPDWEPVCLGKGPGYYFLKWWDGKKRRRERAGITPSEAVEAQRRKQRRRG